MAPNFLTLPAEIRLRIYDFYLEEYEFRYIVTTTLLGGVWPRNDNGDSESTEGKSRPSLGLACRTTFKELEPCTRASLPMVFQTCKAAAVAHQSLISTFKDTAMERFRAAPLVEFRGSLASRDDTSLWLIELMYTLECAKDISAQLKSLVVQNTGNESLRGIFRHSSAHQQKLSGSTSTYGAFVAAAANGMLQRAWLARHVPFDLGYVVGKRNRYFRNASITFRERFVGRVRQSLQTSDSSPIIVDVLAEVAVNGDSTVNMKLTGDEKMGDKAASYVASFPKHFENGFQDRSKLSQYGMPFDFWYG